ncbi:MAG: HEPN domain-containing protein [Dehalococcoidales bacterium]
MSSDLCRDYLDRASSSLREAEESLRRYDWPLCVLRSAECVEFSLKAILRLADSEYKREHDVSGVLINAYDKFPEWFRAKLPRISLFSRVFSYISLSAKYGDELLKVSPKMLFDRPEAQAYLEFTRQTYHDCYRLFSEFKKPGS